MESTDSCNSYGKVNEGRDKLMASKEMNMEQVLPDDCLRAHRSFNKWADICMVVRSGR